MPEEGVTKFGKFAMDYSSLVSISDTHNWIALIPEISLCLTGLFLLLADVLIPPGGKPWLIRFGVGLNILLLGYLLFSKESASTEVLFGGMIDVTSLSQWFRGFFLITQLGVFWLAGNYFKNRALLRTEFYAVVNIVTAGMMLLAHSSSFVVLFVALETVTIGLYVLVAYDRNSEFSLESALKYLVLGGTNTAILLMGIALIYGAVGSANDPLSFESVRAFLAENPDNLLAKMGTLALFASVAFKVGLVPFHIWIPDVYQGAPTPTTALLSIASKSVGFVLLFLFFGESGVFQPLASFLFPFVLWVTLISLIYGNVTALGYTNLKRLLGMSGVSHGGFLMIGVLVYMKMGELNWISGAILFYLVAYMIASLVVFGVMSILNFEKDEDQDLYDYNGLSEKRPFLAGALTIGVGSLAGIPPLVGFMAKFAFLVAAFQSKMYLLLGVALFAVVVSIFYYFKWIREAFYKDPIRGLSLDGETQEEPSFKGASYSDIGILIFLGVLTVLLGVFPMNLLSVWNFS